MYQVAAPPDILKNYVRYFWSFDHQGAPVVIESFADRYPRLIFQNLDGFHPIQKHDGTTMPATYLSGMDTTHSMYTVGGTYSHFGVSFYPHALKRIFNVDAFELINQMPDLMLFTNKTINDHLHAARTHQERFNILANFLIAKMMKFDHGDGIVNGIMTTAFQADHFNVPALLKQYAISERQLERKFKSAIGVSPKMYLRITRFEKALALLRENRFPNTQDVAYHLGYADHSHFIREFKEFSGSTPLRFLSREKIGAESSSFVVEKK